MRLGGPYDYQQHTALIPLARLRTVIRYLGAVVMQLPKLAATRHDMRVNLARSYRSGPPRVERRQACDAW